MAIGGVVTGATIRIVNPAAEIENQILSLAPRLQSLQGVRIGVVDNSKYMAGSFLKATQSLLEQRYQVSGFEYYKKSSASVPIPPDVMDSLVRSCDAVIHGVAD